MAINKADQVTIDVNRLTDKECTVNWQQSFSQRSQQYYCIPVQKGGEESMIFVQKSYLDNFKGKISGNTFTVDGSFQYGQRDNSGAGRFLVFHDKSQKAYMWRFFEGVISKLGNDGAEMMRKLGIPTDVGQLRQSIGDYLRDY